MTIELITGTPGAGKTTYGVATRMVAECGRKIRMPDDECLKMQLPIGHEIERRIVQAGVRGLLVPHERLPHTLTGESMSEDEVDFWNAAWTETDVEAGRKKGEPVFKRLPGQPAWTSDDFANLAVQYADDTKVSEEWFRPSLFNWWLWAKPGDLVFIDEVQFIAQRGTLGKKPPLWAALLEIHRHYGIDFIFVTQHPQLIDTTIRALCGMHRHVRSIMGSGLCMVYVWDHAANPERYTNANKEKFLRRAKHYRLFKSASAHVKPPTSGRAVLWLAPLLIGLAIAGFYRFEHRLIKGGDANAAPISSSPSATHGTALQLPSSTTTTTADVRPAGWVDVPKLSGCFTVGERCSCIRDDGRPLNVALQMCRTSAAGFDGLVLWERRKEQPKDAPAYGAAAAQFADRAASSPSPLLHGLS